VFLKQTLPYATTPPSSTRASRSGGVSLQTDGNDVTHGFFESKGVFKTIDAANADLFEVERLAPRKPVESTIG
jgi:hypothetical protein